MPVFSKSGFLVSIKVNGPDWVSMALLSERDFRVEVAVGVGSGVLVGFAVAIAVTVAFGCGSGWECSHCGGRSGLAGEFFQVKGDLIMGLVGLIGALCAWPGSKGGGVKVEAAFGVNVADFASDGVGKGGLVGIPGSLGDDVGAAVSVPFEEPALFFLKGLLEFAGEAEFGEGGSRMVREV